MWTDTLVQTSVSLEANAVNPKYATRDDFGENVSLQPHVDSVCELARMTTNSWYDTCNWFDWIMRENATELTKEMLDPAHKPCDNMLAAESTLMGCGLKSYNQNQSIWVVCMYVQEVNDGGIWPCCHPPPNPDVCIEVL